ncbi:MAG: DMT family transporter [bacterium]|nr:DMT family transporter [bacterium]
MWLFFVITAHLLSAIVFVADKYILAREVKSPIVYAFYNGILSVFVFLLLPYVANFPERWVIWPALASGVSFGLALIFFYRAILKNSTGRIIPLIGTLVPIFTFFLSHIFLAEKLSRNQFIAFYLLILGGILITAEQKRRNLFSRQGIVYGLLAAFLFAISFVMAKYTYEHAPFWTGFIWTRIGAIILALSIFLIPRYRRQIKSAPKRAGIKVGASYLAVRSFSAVSFILLNYAIAIASVAIVNALQGVQYVFLMIIAIVLSKKLPALFASEFKDRMAQRIIAIVLITFGLAILAFK